MRKEFTTAEELNTFTRTLDSGSFQILTETNNGKLVYIVTDEHPENDPFGAVFDFSKLEK